MNKRFAWTLVEVSSCKVNVIAELTEKSLFGSYVLSPWSNLAHALPRVKGFSVTLNDLYRSRVKVISYHAKNISQSIFDLPLNLIWLILYVNRVFG